MRRSNFAQRLQPSLLEELTQNCGIGKRGSKPAHSMWRGEKGAHLSFNMQRSDSPKAGEREGTRGQVLPGPASASTRLPERLIRRYL